MQVHQERNGYYFMTNSIKSRVNFSSYYIKRNDTEQVHKEQPKLSLCFRPVVYIVLCFCDRHKQQLTPQASIILLIHPVGEERKKPKADRKSNTLQQQQLGNNDKNKRSGASLIGDM